MAHINEFNPATLFAALNRARVRYMVVGGHAVSAYGAVRATKDADLIVDFVPSNLRKLRVALTGIGFMPKVPEDPERLADPQVRNRWIRQKGMRVFSFVGKQPPFYLVDIMVHHRGDFTALYRRRRYARFNRLRIPLAPIEHLMRMKRAAGRPQDLDDVRKLRWLLQHTPHSV